jgi:hypothetical protein
VADLSDETLMAYADGVLDPALRDVVEAAMRDNPEYRVKVEKFRTTLAPIRRAFQDGPLPQQSNALIDKLGKMGLRPDQTNPPIAPGQGWQFGAGKGSNGRAAARRPMAIAASIALMVGVGLGWALRPNDTSLPRDPNRIALGERGLSAEGALRQLLETARSGTPLVVASGGHTWKLKASFTFKSIDGEFCRRYEMTNATDGSFAGYACRGDDGQWLVQAHLKSDGLTPNGKSFVPSAGKHDAALDAAIDATREGDVLDVEVENKLIQTAWQSGQP